MTYWDTIAIDERVELGTHLFEPEEIKRFARAYDPQRFHLDEAAAKETLFGGLCASGWHTTAVYMRLNVEWQKREMAAWVARGHPPVVSGPSPGIKNLCWLKPVYAGDRIAYAHIVTGKRVSATKPGWGLISWRAEAANQAGEMVMSFEATAFLSTD